MRNFGNDPFHSPFGEGSSAAKKAGVRTLLIAAAITIALYFVPYAGYVTYPIRLLVTFIHEGSHALLALLTGSPVEAVAIMPNGSGVTLTRPSGYISSLLTSSAGYLGAMAYGAAIVSLLRKGIAGRRLLFGTAIAVGLVTLGAFRGLLALGMPGLEPFGLLFAMFWGVLLTLGLLVAAKKLPPEAADWTAAFIGVQCVLNALFDLHTLFGLSVSTGVQTDAVNMERLTLLPAPLWAGLWIVMALGILLFVLRPEKAPRRAPVWR